MIYKNKQITIFQVTLIVLSIFAFAYFINESSKNIILVEENNYKNNSPNIFSSIFTKIFQKIKSPIFNIVSAAELDINSGCCALSDTNDQCLITLPEQCVSDFAEGSLCETTSFCQKGCCYNSELGIFDSNVLESDCTQDWIPNPTCKIPEAERGCCVLGTKTIYETFGQCSIDTEKFARANSSSVDWRPELNEAQCILLSQTQDEGACVLIDSSCTYTTQGACIQSNGQFYKDFLCTAKELNTNCKPSKETTCVPGKDGVYFKDTCGNIANIYDSSKVDDSNYWERLVEPNFICGDTSENANANSKTCGNCNRFVGSICSPALDDGFDVDWGNYYCKPTECTFQGETYKNGESWCAYDGKTGDGDDVPGSRHFKYVCNQGNVDIEPCADYRNQICIQQNTFEFGETEVSFKNAACVTNNWRECINLNSEEDGLEKCSESLNCELTQVNVSEYFTFDTCTPKYPAGFATGDERYQATTQSICAIASRNCTAVRQSNFFGTGCTWVANKECLDDNFADQMNNLCTSLGDCGTSVNINGDLTENIKILRDDDATPPSLTREAINHLKKLSEPHPEIYAKVEDYSAYLEASGFFVNPAESPIATGPNDPSSGINKVAMGLGGIGYAAGVAGIYSATGVFNPTLSLLSTAIPSSPGLTFSSAAVGFASVAIGAALGAIAGMYIAKAIGSSPFGTILMATGGALIGATAAAWYAGYILFFSFAGTIPVAGWIIAAVGALIMAIGALFGSASCDPIEVQFECKPWQPPSGGDSCDVCNQDPTRPCSEYRCSSLGASCVLENKGTENEICIDTSPNDVTSPLITPNYLFENSEQEYNQVTQSSFTISSSSSECIDAYNPISLAINTNEPAICRFDFKQIEYENMALDFGNLYLKNHTTIFQIPDIRSEQNLANWDGNLDIFIKCSDRAGNKNQNFYVVKTCVNDGPDITPPLVRSTTPTTNSIIGFEKEKEQVRIITNEPARCKWSKEDVSYPSMSNSFTCADSFKRPSNPFGYVCTGELPTTEKENTFYIKCEDQPTETEDKRNTMSESYVLNLKKPESKLEITSIHPSEKITTNVDFTQINLEIETSGGGSFHKCSYSFSGYNKLIELLETGKERIHKQPLTLPTGTKNVYVDCRDETGERVRKESSFEILKDDLSTQIARVYQDAGIINFITTRESVCKYSTSSCNFDFSNATLTGEGMFHKITSSKGKTNYIKCISNGQVPNSCSLIVKAV